jgi:hypothetical protein
MMRIRMDRRRRRRFGAGGPGLTATGRVLHSGLTDEAAAIGNDFAAGG